MSNGWEKIIKEGNLRYKWNLLTGKKKDDFEKINKHVLGIVFKSKEFKYKIDEIFGFGPIEIHELEDLNEISILMMVRAIMEAIYEHEIEFVILLDYLKIDIFKTRSFIRLIDLLKNYPGLPSSIEFFGYLYERKSGWVFNSKKFQKINSQEEISQLHAILIREKKIELIKYLEKIHQNLKQHKKSKNMESISNDKTFVIDKKFLNQKAKKHNFVTRDKNNQKSDYLKPYISIKRISSPITNTYRIKKFKIPTISIFNKLCSATLIKIPLIKLPETGLKNLYNNMKLKNLDIGNPKQHWSI
ncbi:MAG: hypothetical protein GF383_13780 [Candidatus Lokiarchaeota archaeon]|nr:hypothetical protein [Candidatus Lokiarchaeota archaeon]MBD3342341.1 hypothetical protein [Candidatus Lokiarchaeota archaeon]